MLRTAQRLGILTVIAVGLLALPGSAMAADCYVDLVDSAGFTSDLEDSGAIGDGYSTSLDDAFDTWGYATIDGSSYYAADSSACTYEDADREVVYPVETMAGLEVSRKVYVPATGFAFTRFVTVIHNPTAAPITASYSWDGNLGSDSDTAVLASSSGDALVSTADDWATSEENYGGSTDPKLAWGWQGATGVQRATTAFFEDTDDSPVFGYDLSVAAGETQLFAHFVAMRTSNEDTLAAAQTFAANDEMWAGMSEAELALVRNWRANDFDGDDVKNTVDNCRSIANADQLDTDADGQGNVCDLDDDGDGWEDAMELTIGTDPLKSDTDGDAVGDKTDKCPVTAGASSDGCGIQNAQVLTCPSGTSTTVVCLEAETGAGLVIVGSSGADVLVGSSNADTLFGGGGNDRISGGFGRDTIFGGSGNDVLNGGGGGDALRGGPGADRSTGGTGNDVVDGDGGNDRLDGGAHNDIVRGGLGTDVVSGGNGNDVLFGGAHGDLLRGGAGFDSLNGGTGNDRLFGGLGRDRLFGGAGRDREVQ